MSEYFVCELCGDIVKASPEDGPGDSPDIHVVTGRRRTSFYCTPCMTALLRENQAFRAEYPNKSNRDAFWQKPGRKAAWRKLHPSKRRSP